MRLARSTAVRSGVLAFAVSVILSTEAVAQTPDAAQSRPATTADTEETKKEAIERFKRGLELYEEGAFAAALIEFRRANELAPNWRLHYNIAQVCAQTQDYVCALASFNEYLTAGAGSIPEERRAEVEKEISRLRARVATIVIRSNVAGAEVSIDDRPAGTTPLRDSITVNSGRHKITLSKVGYTSVVRLLDIAGQESQELDLTLVAQTTTPAPTKPIAMPKTAPRPASTGMTPLSWTGVGVAGALALTAGITGALALSGANDLKEKRYATPDDGRSDGQRVSTFAAVADISAAAAIVTLGTTLALTFLIRREGPSADGLKARLGPTSAGLEGTF